MNTQHIPNVLLLGNGVNQSFEDKSWKKFIGNLSKRKDLPDTMEISYPLQIILATDNNVENCIADADNKKLLRGNIENKEKMDFFHSILDLGFEHIITTNYSYELECAAISKKTITDYMLKQMQNHTKAVKQAEGKYMLRTYNEVNFNGKTIKIWHIHGEARKHSSIILGHYVYGTLLSKYKNYVDSRGSYYSKCKREEINASIDSWIDAFIFGNVYSLGFGFSRDEFDLWWLLNRKYRENAKHGKLFFYDLPKIKMENSFNEKYELLKLFDVEIRNCKMEKTDESDYIKFYKKAINEIGSIINGM